MFTEIQLWEQADEDRLSVPLDTTPYEARLLFGCKLIRDRLSGKIEFYNTAKGGDYYVKLKDKEIDIFKTYGLKQGVYWLMMSNILIKIEDVNNKIRNEVNNKNNFRKIQTYKNYRERLIKLFHHQTKQFKERNYVKDEINLGNIIQD